MYGRSRVNVKVEPRSTWMFTRRPYIHWLYFIYARKNYATVQINTSNFYVRTHINLTRVNKREAIIGLTLEAKFISSKHLEIWSCSVENMASHLLTKHITWSKSCQSLRSLNLVTAARAHRAHGLRFLLVKCVLKCSVTRTWRRTSASLNCKRFHGHQVMFN